MSVKRLLGILVVLLVLAGCGGSSKPHVAPSAASRAVVAPGPTTFASDARRIGFGSKDFASATDDQLVSFGNTICEGFTVEGLTYGRVSQGLSESKAGPTAVQVGQIIKSAVTNLCPDQARQVP